MIIVIKEKRGAKILRGEFDNDAELERAKTECIKAELKYKKEIKASKKKLYKVYLNEIKQRIKNWK